MVRVERSPKTITKPEKPRLRRTADTAGKEQDERIPQLPLLTTEQERELGQRIIAMRLGLENLETIKDHLSPKQKQDLSNKRREGRIIFLMEHPTSRQAEVDEGETPHGNPSEKVSLINIEEANSRYINQVLDALSQTEDSDEKQRLTDDLYARFMGFADEGIKAHDLLILHNFGLVKYAASKFKEDELPFDDRVSAGWEGLMIAASKFDPYMGYKFSTYAIWWIRQTIKREINNTGKTVRLPVHVVESLAAVRRLQEEMVSKLGKLVTLEEAIDAASDVNKLLHMVLTIHDKVISLNTRIVSPRDGQTGELGDFIEDKQQPPDELVYDKSMAKKLREVMSDISRIDHASAREMKVLELRFGLGDKEPMTLDCVGKILGVTRERVRQLEKRAMEKLRDHPSAYILKSFFAKD